EVEVLRLAAAAESGSEHPIARAVLGGARNRGVPIPPASDHEVAPGAGARARIDGSLVRVGRPVDLPAALTDAAGRLAAGGLTVFAVWRDGQTLGLLGVADSVKAGAPAAVA